MNLSRVLSVQAAVLVTLCVCAAPLAAQTSPAARGAGGSQDAKAVRDDGVVETVVYLVRHAEKADDGTDDPPLSDAGQRRAERLARMLSGAGLTAVHTTPYARTRGTARPVAERTGLTPLEYDPRDLQGLARRLSGEGGRHLVVGHSNTTPALAALLGGDSGGGMTEEEYGRVYQLTIRGDDVRTVILGYPGGYLADPPPTAASGGADPGDVATVESLLTALYDVISGPAGEPRDWDRLRSLFLPTAHMIPVQRSPDGSTAYRALTVEDYIRTSGPMLERVGFREHEIGRRMEWFGDVAHVFSTYEAYREGQDEVFMRGVNTIQVIHDGQRWWITSIAWSPERPDLPIPDRYLLNP